MIIHMRSPFAFAGAVPPAAECAVGACRIRVTASCRAAMYVASIALPSLQPESPELPPERTPKGTLGVKTAGETPPDSMSLNPPTSRPPGHSTRTGRRRIYLSRAADDF